MKEKKIIDAVGLDCPKPVLLTREAVDAGERELEIIVDNQIALNNVTRFLQNAGYLAAHTEEDGRYRIRGRADAAVGHADKTTPDGASESRITGDEAFLILSEHIGASSDGLGEVLMKAFLGTLASRKPRPAVIALMNDGVKLALPSSTCSETLGDLERAGVRVLVCGTCTKHFGVTDEIVVGVVSNMFDITEAVFGASKPIVLG